MDSLSYESFTNNSLEYFLCIHNSKNPINTVCRIYYNVNEKIELHSIRNKI